MRPRARWLVAQRELGGESAKSRPQFTLGARLASPVNVHLSCPPTWCLRAGHAESSFRQRGTAHHRKTTTPTRQRRADPPYTTHREEPPICQRVRAPHPRQVPAWLPNPLLADLSQTGGSSMLTLPDDRGATGLPRPGIEALAHQDRQHHFHCGCGQLRLCFRRPISPTACWPTRSDADCCQRGVSHAGSRCEFLVLARRSVTASPYRRIASMRSQGSSTTLPSTPPRQTLQRGLCASDNG